MRFLVNGSIAYDLLLSHDGSFLTGIDPKHLESLSVNYMAQGFVRHHGGTAANIGWNVASLGHTPLLMGAVGHDGNEYLELLEKRGADTSFVDRRTDAFTATAVIATDTSERQISFFHPGADALGSMPDLKNSNGKIDYAIMSPRNPLLMLQCADVCAKLKIPYLFDPGQVVHAFSDDDLRRAVSKSAGLVVNEYEWQLASKKLGWDEKAVVKSCGMVVITLGEKGLRIVTRTEDLMVPASKAKKFVNPTGAGDAVRAGLLIGLASKWPLVHTGRLAAVLGCLVVEQEGTLLDKLTWDMVQERAEGSYGERLPT